VSREIEIEIEIEIERESTVGVFVFIVVKSDRLIGEYGINIAQVELVFDFGFEGRFNLKSDEFVPVYRRKERMTLYLTRFA
jgi:hypothetical protein